MWLKGKRGLNTDFAANSLSFSTPTHTHKSDNHSNVYGHPNSAIKQSFSGAAGNWFGLNELATWNDFGLWRRLQLLSFISCLFD
jgi:hypothetical protein